MSPTGFQNRAAGNGIPVLLPFVLLLSGLSGPLMPSPASGELVKRNAVLMGTNIELTASESDRTQINDAFDAALHEISRIEEMMSEWKEGSPVSMINREAGKEPVPVPEELFHVIEAAQKISELSGGAFDISWAAMRGLWKFSKGDEKVPSPDEIRAKLPLINFREIELNEAKKTVFLKRPGMAIGLGGIAKGYAVDKAMQVMASHGIKNAIVKAGGDMRVQGTEDGQPWSIGIQDPRNRGKLIAQLPLSNISISTSGDYEHYFVKDGTLYHHIIDPKTGFPARGCRSVTILAPDTLTSDPLATAVFVLGPDKGMKLIESLPGIQGIIVDDRGKVRSSSGIEPSTRRGKNP